MIPKTTKLESKTLSSQSSEQRKSLKRKSWQVSANLPSSFKYATQGLIYSFRTQQNFQIHLVIATLVCALSVWLRLDIIKVSILTLTIAIVLVLELLNTAIEAVVDLTIGNHFDQLARIAKDCAAAAVLVASISSVLIASMVLLPSFLNRLGL